MKSLLAQMEATRENGRIWVPSNRRHRPLKGVGGDPGNLKSFSLSHPQPSTVRRVLTSDLANEALNPMSFEIGVSVDYCQVQDSIGVVKVYFERAVEVTARHEI